MPFRTGETRGRRARLVTAAALFIAVLAAVLVLIDGGTGGAEAAGVDPETRATLGVFRSARTQADQLPDDLRTALQAADETQTGENPSLSRRVQHAGGVAYVWPMAGGVCHSSPAGGGCVPTRSIRDRGVDIGVQSVLDLRARTYAEVRLFGIARDGVASVRVTLHNGEERTAIVRANTFLILDLRDRPAAVSWTDETGAHSIDVPGQTAEELAEEIVGR
jgi:hypothetical protein